MPRGVRTFRQGKAVVFTGPRTGPGRSCRLHPCRRLTEPQGVFGKVSPKMIPKTQRQKHDGPGRVGMSTGSRTRSSRQYRGFPCHVPGSCGPPRPLSDCRSCGWCTCDGSAPPRDPHPTGLAPARAPPAAQSATCSRPIPSEARYCPMTTAVSRMVWMSSGARRQSSAIR